MAYFIPSPEHFNPEESMGVILYVLIGSFAWMVSLTDIPVIMKDWVLPFMAFAAYSVAIGKTFWPWLKKTVKNEEDKPEQL